MWLRSNKRELRIRISKSISAIPRTILCNQRKRKRSKNISSEKFYANIVRESASSIEYHKKDHKLTTLSQDDITLLDGKLKSKRLYKSTGNSQTTTDSLSVNNESLNCFEPILYNSKSSTLDRGLEKINKDCCCSRLNNSPFSEKDQRFNKNNKCISECDSTTQLENDLQSLSSSESLCVDYLGKSLINFNHVPVVDSTTDIIQADGSQLNLPSTSAILYCHDTLMPIQEDVQHSENCLESPKSSTFADTQLYPTTSNDSISMYDSNSMGACTSNRNSQLNELCQYSDFFHYTNGTSMLSEDVDMHVNSMIPIQHQSCDIRNYSSQSSFGAEAIENLKALSSTNFTDKSTTITLVNSQIYASQR